MYIVEEKVTKILQKRKPNQLKGTNQNLKSFF